VGEGKMQILLEQPNQQINYSLSFLKPWKSEAEVSFKLISTEQGVQVTWTMDSKLPFFLFWMKKMMVAFIGMDYQRGLNMLKDLVELGEIPSKIEFKGVSKFSTIQYIGIKTQSSQENIGENMEQDFKQLQNFTQQHPALANGEPLSIYHKWDIVKQVAEYTAAVPVNHIPESLPAEFVSGTIPETKIYTIRHIGKYEHLGNAWSTLYNMQQNKEIKCDKGIHPFEVYINDPANVQAEELITDIHFPLK
jgi:effector-binding domain-containing protein